MSARSRMVHRAVHERDAQSGSDDYGHTGAPSWATQSAALACYLYTKRARRTLDGDKTVTVESLRAMVPFGTDIVAGDRMTTFVDARSRSIHANALYVRGVLRRETHIEVDLRDAAQA